MQGTGTLIQDARLFAIFLVLWTWFVFAVNLKMRSCPTYHWGQMCHDQQRLRNSAVRTHHKDPQVNPETLLTSMHFCVQQHRGCECCSLTGWQMRCGSHHFLFIDMVMDMKGYGSCGIHWYMKESVRHMEESDVHQYCERYGRDMMFTDVTVMLFTDMVTDSRDVLWYGDVVFFIYMVARWPGEERGGHVMLFTNIVTDGEGVMLSNMMTDERVMLTDMVWQIRRELCSPKRSWFSVHIKQISLSLSPFCGGWDSLKHLAVVFSSSAARPSACSSPVQKRLPGQTQELLQETGFQRIWTGAGQVKVSQFVAFHEAFFGEWVCHIFIALAWYKSM